MTDQPTPPEPSSSKGQAAQTHEPPKDGPRDGKGWDGKLRVGRRAVVTNPDGGASESGHSEEETLPADSIEAGEEGKLIRTGTQCWQGSFC